MANFKNLSRYTGGQITKNRSDKDFLILRRSLNLAQDEGDVFVQVTKELEKRPDLVASKAYNNPDLWWVIYDFNNIRDPFFDLKAGALLRIPSLQRVLQAIQSLED